MSTSRESRKQLDEREKAKDDYPIPQEVIDAREAFTKGPIRTLPVIQIRGDVMTDARGNTWQRVQSRNASVHDSRWFIPGWFATRDQTAQLQYFTTVDCPKKLSTDVLYVEESGAEWKFMKKGQAQWIAEEAA